MSTPAGLAAAMRQNAIVRKQNLERHIHPDTARLDFLEAQGVDIIYLRGGRGIDVRNSGRGTRAAIDEAREMPTPVPREALAIGADLDPASLEQGDPA
ncbi:hypothetical protein AVME950_02465 [Acidovorax sp. SUPP950]|uniref:hypothetical protein n=1 Tax=Acidovorax sp. SUPP950 TaxID=511901 RepID=UPI0023C2B17D|nr:hypothetical protein [Acidovorax sp. SUPP950]GKS73711.1 hypothetical protein AVME950_02465 [Acidovorax sp. SUPP950]